ncbi:MAG: secondary thiamine-phosphate synthase enzyme YjbQ [Methermicoccaceae archaeon]
MSVRTEEVRLSTEAGCTIYDITASVEEAVGRTSIKDGMVLLFVPGSTAAITTIEYESGAVHDLKAAIERLFPQDIEYRHNLRWGDDNGHSHVRAAMMGPSLMVPLVNGKLVLGTWQQVVFVELDVRPRQRRIVVQVMGE